MTKRNRLFVLNDPHAMRVSKELATEIGLNQSIVLLQIDFLIAHTNYIREGLPWIRMTVQEMKSEYFDFWSDETLRRTVQDLKDRKLIRIANFNRRGFDRTQWITLDVAGCSKLKSLTITHFGEWNGSSSPTINNTDDPAAITQNEESQVSGQFPLDDPDLLTAVDEERDAPIPQNGESTTSDRGIDDHKSGDAGRDLRDASPQSEATIVGRDLEKRLTSSGRDAQRPRPEPKRINIGKLLAEVLPAGKKIPRSFKGHLGREMHKLAAEGITVDVIRDAAKACIEKGLNPHNLPSLAVEVRSSTRRHQTFQNADQSDYEDAVIQ